MSALKKAHEEAAKAEAYRRWIQQAGGTPPTRAEFESIAAELVQLGYWERVERPGRDAAFQLTPKGRLQAMRIVGEIREGYA